MPTATLETRQFGKDLLHLLGWPALLIAAFVYWFEPWKLTRHSESTPDAFRARVVGTWDYAGNHACQDNPHRISFSEDGRVMTLTYRRASPGFVLPQRTFVYDVSQATDSGIVATMRGETRNGASGTLAVWELLLMSEDSYAWRESDWPGMTHNPRMERCPASTDSLIPPVE